MITIEEELEFSIRIAKDQMHKLGKLAPMAVLVIEDKRAIVLCNFESRDEKQRFVYLLKKMVKELGASRLVFISECWMRHQSIDEKVDESRPVSSYPDKEEALMIQIMDRVGRSLYASLKMHRVDGHVILDEDNCSKDWTNYENFMFKGVFND